MNLFVSKLNSSTTTKDLQKLFSHYGLVTTVKVIFDHVTGRSKSYGFVEMPNNNEAHEALKELDKTPFQEYIISVRESQTTDSSIAEVGLKFRNRSTTEVNTQEGTNRENLHRTYPTNKPPHEDNSLRNFGYRGNGNRSFR